MTFLTCACVRYTFETITAYEITIMSFFQKNEFDENGIDPRYFGDLRTVPCVPPRSHVMNDCIKQMKNGNRDFDWHRKREMVHILEEEEEEEKEKYEFFTEKSMVGFEETLAKIIDGFALDEKQRMGWKESRVRLKTAGNGRVNSVSRCIVWPVMTMEALNNQQTDDKYGQITVCGELIKDVRQLSVPFSYWTLLDVHYLWRWIEFGSQKINLKKYASKFYKQKFLEPGDNDESESETGEPSLNKGENSVAKKERAPRIAHISSLFGENTHNISEIEVLFYHLGE